MPGKVGSDSWISDFTTNFYQKFPTKYELWIPTEFDKKLRCPNKPEIPNLLFIEDTEIRETRYRTDYHIEELVTLSNYAWTYFATVNLPGLECSLAEFVCGANIWV